MPTLGQMRIPATDSWSEFQEIVASALKVRWNTSNLQVHGCNGQSQFGVDISGTDDLDREVGVQCRSGKVTIKDIRTELNKAKQFGRLEAFWFTTATKRDGSLFRAVRQLSSQRRENGECPVGILFWEDLCQDLVRDNTEFAKHFPQFAPREFVANVEGDFVVTEATKAHAKACQAIYSLSHEIYEGLPSYPDMEWADVLEFVAWDFGDHEKELASIIKTFGTVLDDKLLSSLETARSSAARGKVGVSLRSDDGPTISHEAMDRAE